MQERRKDVIYMSYYSPSIEKLIEAFEKLPSIGNKTAARLAFYMLNCSNE